MTKACLLIGSYFGLITTVAILIALSRTFKNWQQDNKDEKERKAKSAAVTAAIQQAHSK
tara:strand:- start:221 stop:397 length:177 start_codon:yes stop_codon:yes gene_type:complete